LHEMEKFLTPTGHFLPEKKIDFRIFDGWQFQALNLTQLGNN